jgi:hypothetical protein
MDRSQPRDPRQHARKQRETTGGNEDPDRRHEKATDDSSDSRPAAESTDDALKCSGAAIGNDSQRQEGERETDAVERQEQRSARWVASRGCNAQDRTKDDADARRPRDRKGGTE